MRRVGPPCTGTADRRVGSGHWLLGTCVSEKKWCNGAMSLQFWGCSVPRVCVRAHARACVGTLLAHVFLFKHIKIPRESQVLGPWDEATSSQCNTTFWHPSNSMDP